MTSLIRAGREYRAVDDLPEWCRKYIGLPSVECGRGPDQFDCFGLLRHIYDIEHGITLNPFSSFRETFAAEAERKIAEEKASWLAVREGEERAFDVVLCYKIFKENKHYILRPLHLGVVVTPGVMIHAEGQIGACVENYRENPIWEKRVAGFFRHRTFATGEEEGPAEPFARHRLRASEGVTIRDLLTQADFSLEAFPFLHVFDAKGEEILEGDWDKPRSEGESLEIVALPQGGGAGLRMGLQVGIIGLALAAGLATGGVLAPMAVSMIGTLAMGMFLPPPVNKPAKIDPASPAYSISGARNAIRPGSPVPALFGKFRCVPPMAGWYTGSTSNKRFFYGIYEISNGLISDPVIRIGDTLIDKYPSVSIILDRGWHPSQMTSRGSWNPKNNWPTSPRFGNTWRASFAGTVPGTDLTFNIDDTITFNGLYPATDARAWDVNQNKPRANWPFSVTEENIGASLPYGNTGVTRTSGLGANELQIDIGLDQLGRITGQGKFDDLTVNFDVLEAPVENPAARRSVGKMRVNGKTQDAVFTGERWTVSGDSPTGQYNVTVRRLTPESSGGDSQYLSDATWLNLKTIRHSDPVKVKGYARLFVKIRSTGQLTGVLDKLSVECQRIGPVWDKAAKVWSWKPSSNPATAYRLLLQSPSWGDRLSDASIDLSSLQRWAEFCDTHKLSFNGYVDFLTTRDKLLSDICRAGFSAWTMEMGTGRISVCTDPVDKPNPIPVRFFSPANSWNMRWQYDTSPIPDFIRVTFSDEKRAYSVQTFEVYNDGKNPDNAETSEDQQYFGITSQSAAHLFARMELASKNVRRLLHTRSVGPEYLGCKIGDVVGLADDTLAIGLGRSGRIQRLTYAKPDWTGGIAGCILDQPIEMKRNENYALAISGENAFILKIITDPRAGGTTVIRFAEILSENNAIREDDTWTFGIADRVVAPLLVRDIRPDSRDGSAEVNFVTLPPQLATVLKDIPDYQDFATLPTTLPAPIVDSIISDATVMQSTLRGDLVARVVFRLRPIRYTGYSVTVMFRLSNTDHEWSTAQASALSPGQIAITGVSESATYDFILFYEGAGMFTSPATTIRGHKVVGRTAPPEPLAGLQLTVLSGNVVQARWEPIKEADVRAGGGIYVRHSMATSGVTWARSVSILSEPLEGTSVSALLPYIPGTYLFCLQDSSGLWSDISFATILDHSAQTYTNLSSIREDPAFLGEKQNLQNVSGSLRIIATGFNAIPNVNAIPVFNSAGTTVQGMGIYYFSGIIDLGSVKSVRVRRHMEGYNDLINDSFLARTGLLSSWRSWSGLTEAPGDCWVELRYSSLDPASNPWSPWRRVEVTELTTRWIQPRALIFTTNAAYTFTVTQLGLSIDVL